MKNNSGRDMQYTNIVNDILEHKEFIKTKEVTHHGMNRYDHSVRVSYYSYKLAKMLKLDYEEVARAGLLHDFFLVDNIDFTIKEKLNTLVNHPKYAVAFASKYFDLNDKEKDIILTHMFPIAINRLPKYAESWLVNVVDNAIAISEAMYTYKYQLTKVANISLLVLLNFFRL